MKQLMKLLIALVVCAGIVAATGWHFLSNWSLEKGPLTAELVLEFKPGTKLKELAVQLESLGAIDDADMFVMWVRAKRNYNSFQAGTYKIEPESTPTTIFSKLAKGESFEPVLANYTIPEGFTAKQVMERLAANGIGHIVANINLIKDKKFLESLNIPGSSIEGFIFPATYSYTYIPTAHQAVKNMVETFWQKMPKGYEEAVKAKGLTLYQAITFASLIELETKHDEEKPLISEVIWSRLKDGVPLAIDAAVIYGITDYDGDIKTKHLKDPDNLYNTRIHKGLPPTPIGAPSTKAIEAVLTPTSSKYYYYVLKPGDTRHYFSKSLKEHNENVKKYVEWARKVNKR